MALLFAGCGGGSGTVAIPTPPTPSVQPLQIADVQKIVQAAVNSANADMVVAVVDRAGFVLGVFRTQNAPSIAIGNFRATVDANDLAVALAIASSVANLSLPQGVIVVGEVGLAGEVRNVAGVPRRVAEAERMGFRQAIVPNGSASGSGTDSAMEVIEVEDVREALKAAFRG